MKNSLLLLSVLVAATYASPVHQLFEPFGAFLQGEILNNASFYSEENYSAFFDQFKQTLEDDAHLEKLLNEFKGKFNRVYQDDAEVQRRKEIYKTNLLNIFEHNIKAASGKSSFTKHINQFGDMHIDEIVKGLTGYTFPNGEDYPKELSAEAPKKVGIPYANSWVAEWRGKYDTPVQNQGGCGACVYFSAAACIEYFWAIRGHLPAQAMSPQQINDCAHGNGNSGSCSGGSGTFVPTFDYIRNHGLNSMQNYPWQGKDMGCDHNKENHPTARISKWTPIQPHGNEEALRSSIEHHGPAAVAIHVSDGWARYRGGIFDEPCAGGRNHGVLALGYGWDAGSNKNFWVVKNQWGSGFGEGGYIRMRRDAGNMCDIAGDAVMVE